ncbi:uncharacterized protein LOC107222349 isoform X1 [Neodiprion lecontei]|uniref:Uncharacterized protein LOC107222349 isoform X1 n=1 Tax=Neodiprion lecontei TaxID=441921 RepID=A0A6J0BQY5_NEOLC|nr:uncharacterized protein LOC107222349 isoform X1 [Neodiprion lecontei]
MELAGFRECEDVLGFTNQTAVLLSGMGAKELVPQFRERNISTEMLANLTHDDLVLLGASHELAHRMLKQLSPILRRTSLTVLTPQQKLDQLLESLENNGKHLSLINAFVTYTRLRLNKEKMDSFIEINGNLRSSQALELAVAATISEIEEARSALQELKLSLEDGGTSRSTTFYFATVSGLGLLTWMLFKTRF